jgi:LmbE family N-acetylglucosaminyl deacetylase
MAPDASSASIRLRADRSATRVVSATQAFGAGPWLVVVPHDDDLVLGMGLLLGAAAGHVEVHVAIATDGAMGYARVEDRSDIVAVRRHELERAAAALGIAAERIHWLGFADGVLALHQGCRPPGEPPGLGQSIAGLIREVRASTVFACAPSDTHPDHRITTSEVDIAVFWASSRIWLELGEPVALPSRWDYAVYCAFDGAPDAELRGDHALLERKLAALACFESQGVIDPMVEELRRAGPVEYFRRAGRSPYQPGEYRALFE